MFHSQIVSQIIAIVNTKEKTEEIIHFSKKKFDLHQFNIQNLYPKDVKKMHDSLKRRYKRQQIQILPTNWNQGQRRLFVWFIICFLYVKSVSLVEIIQNDLQCLSEVFYGKAPIFLDFQLKNLPKAHKGKRNWSSEQDELLKYAIKQLKDQCQDGKVFNNWNDVAKIFFFETKRRIFKTPKACRQRWYNHVDESKKKDEFSMEEDLILINHILSFNKSWSKIVKILNYTRTEHRIKNRYYTLLRKYQKMNGMMDPVNEEMERVIVREIKRSFEQRKVKCEQPEQIHSWNSKTQVHEVKIEVEIKEQTQLKGEGEIKKNQQQIEDQDLDGISLIQKNSEQTLREIKTKTEEKESMVQQKSQISQTSTKTVQKQCSVLQPQSHSVHQPINHLTDNFLQNLAFGFQYHPFEIYNSNFSILGKDFNQPAFIVNPWNWSFFVNQPNQFQFYYQN